MIKELAAEHPLEDLCNLFEVSRSGYYNWRTRDLSSRDKENQCLGAKIKEIHAQSRKIYGSPRITMALRAEGIKCGHNRVERIMRKMGIRGTQKQRFRPRTTQSSHDFSISPNLLERIDKIKAPNRIWVSDITYIPTKEGWTYLSAVMDLCSREIKGWTLKDTLKTSLVSGAFFCAVIKHKPKAGLIHHSDRGCQYASYQYLDILKEHKALSSMGDTGNCYDNAFMESFWATLKTELNMKVPFQSKEEARLAIFDYIELFYNKKRLHSSLDYLSPSDFEKKFKSNSPRSSVSVFSGEDQ